MVSHFYSTRNLALEAQLPAVVFESLAPDGGLYWPDQLPTLPASFWENAANLSFPELAYELAKPVLGKWIPDQALHTICHEAFNFPVPLVELEQDVFLLELFHGPSLAFKDVGARFMARIMSFLLQQGQWKADVGKPVHVLVATSGDTGGAVAMGFLQTPGIEVTILYPSGKVSHLQEQQLTTLGHNIRAVEVNGSFDDCQALVKKAFADTDLRQQVQLTSANSINFCRLFPQSFYYAWAAVQLRQNAAVKERLVVAVPSGNYGNLCAALIAQAMGCPITHLIASSNANNVVPRYLRSGQYAPLPTVPTISNAMDVGLPSNWERISHHLGGDYATIRKAISGYDFSDEVTTLCMEQIHGLRHQVLEPHTAVGYLGLKSYKKYNLPCTGIVAATAHPAKFLEAMPEKVAADVTIPERLAKLSDRTKASTQMGPDYDSFRQFLLNR